MDAIDRRILIELQRDAHLTNQDLSDRIGLSPSPTMRRVRRLEEEGVISGYRAVVDAARVGYQVTAFVELTLAQQDPATVEAVESRLRDLDQVIEAHTLAGDADYLLKVIAPSLDSYETFVRTRLRELPGLRGIITRFSYATVKDHTPVVPASTP